MIPNLKVEITKGPIAENDGADLLRLRGLELFLWIYANLHPLQHLHVLVG